MVRQAASTADLSKVADDPILSAPGQLVEIAQACRVVRFSISSVTGFCHFSHSVRVRSMRGPCSYRPVIVDPRLALSLNGVGVARRFNVNRQANSKFRSRVGRMDHHANPWLDSKSL